MYVCLLLHRRVDYWFTWNTRKKPFKCDVCLYSTAHKNRLVLHLRKHTGEKPFKCDVCQFSAAIKGNVVRHMGTHTKEKLLSNSDRPSNTCTQKQILNIKDIDDVNSTLPSTDDERDHMKIDQLVDPYNSANVQAHLSSNKTSNKRKKCREDQKGVTR